jgi:hypothetical protein
MKVAIMQPYFFPYIGYFQLMNAVDEFIVYDNIQFTKKGWINRNRILFNEKDIYITLPIKKDSDYLNISDRFLADSWLMDKKKMVSRIVEAYKNAPLFEAAFPVIEKAILFEESNLFTFIFNSLKLIRDYLNIGTTLIVSSFLPVDHALRAGDKVLEICKARKATAYVNPIGGLELYNKVDFKEKDIDLYFLKTGDIKYPQFKNEFIPFLSIIDIMMFNSKEEIKRQLEIYTIA